MKLILIRHGETIENVKGVLCGQLDGTLSSKGIESTEELAKKIFKMDINFESMVISPLGRTKHTADILNEKLKLKIETEDLIKERNFGVGAGKKYLR